jgi:hypothetical protein
MSGVEVNMREFYEDSNRKMEALRKLGRDVLPPNLIYPPLPEYDPKGECRCIKAWWDLGETGLLLYMDWGPDLWQNTDIEFRILSLRSSPYGSCVAPQAELDARTDKDEQDNTPGGKRTLKVEEAEDYITGWVSCDGEVTLNYPNEFYPIGRDDNGNPSIKLTWHNVEAFNYEIQEVIRRVTYEANNGNPQISEEGYGIGVDFEKVSPYDPSAAVVKATYPDERAATKQKDKAGCGTIAAFLIVVSLLYFLLAAR